MRRERSAYCRTVADTTESSSRIQEFQDQARRWIDSAIAKGGLDRADLLALHQSYGTRFAGDNANIWLTGAIFLPLALAAPAAYLALGRRSWVELAVLALASLAIILTWLAVAERHKFFQDRSMEFMKAVEARLGVTSIWSTEADENKEKSFPHVRSAYVRRGMPIVLLTEWLVIAIFQHPK